MRALSLATLALALVVAGCGGGSAGVEAPSGQLGESECRSMATSATTSMGTVAADLATGRNVDALEETIHLVAAKRKAYQGGCISRDEYVRFLTENADSVSTFDCPKCVDVFDRELAALHPGS
jgi:hypothetical protein